MQEQHRSTIDAHKETEGGDSLTNKHEGRVHSGGKGIAKLVVENNTARLEPGVQQTHGTTAHV